MGANLLVSHSKMLHILRQLVHVAWCHKIESITILKIPASQIIIIWKINGMNAPAQHKHKNENNLFFFLHVTLPVEKKYIQKWICDVRLITSSPWEPNCYFQVFMSALSAYLSSDSIPDAARNYYHSLSFQR